LLTVFGSIEEFSDIVKAPTSVVTVAVYVADGVIHIGGAAGNFVTRVVEPVAGGQGRA
jgi:hypothetical protein